MQKINFKNLPNTSTPLNAENLNLMQSNIENDINEKINEIENEISTKTTLSYCIATVTDNQTLTSNYTINLNKKEKSQGNFTLSNGGIKIGAGINKIRVSGNIFVDEYSSGSNYLWGKILKNSTSVATTIVTSNTIFAGTPIPSTIIEVSENDIIKLMADSPAGGKLRTGVANVWLCVEKVE